LVITSKTLVWLLATLFTTDAYNKPYCPSWPADDVWSSELENLLSTDAVLHGPINPEEAYPADCENLGSDAYAISKAGTFVDPQKATTMISPSTLWMRGLKKIFLQP
jgi:hypothetical protein